MYVCMCMYVRMYVCIIILVLNQVHSQKFLLGVLSEKMWTLSVHYTDFI